MKPEKKPYQNNRAGIGVVHLRSGGGHLAEETGTGALLGSGLHGRSVLLGSGGGRVRRLLLGRGGRTGRSGGRARRSAARGGGSGTTLLARHCDVCVSGNGKFTGDLGSWQERRVDIRIPSGDWKRLEAESVGEQANSEANFMDCDWLDQVI